MLFRNVEVAGIARHVTSRVREINQNDDFPLSDQRRFHSGADAVRIHPHERFDSNRFAVQLKLRCMQTRPKIKPPLDVLNFRILDWLKDGIPLSANETDSPQIGAVRILAKPITQRLFFWRE